MVKQSKSPYPPGSDEEHLHDEEIFALFLESSTHPRPSRAPAPAREDDTEEVSFHFEESDF
jgi:hypothetical protein